MLGLDTAGVRAFAWGRAGSVLGVDTAVPAVALGFGKPVLGLENGVPAAAWGLPESVLRVQAGEPAGAPGVLRPVPRPGPEEQACKIAAVARGLAVPVRRGTGRAAALENCAAFLKTRLNYTRISVTKPNQPQIRCTESEIVITEKKIV